MLNIIKYLTIVDVPEDEKQVHKLCIQATHFTLINDQLYKWSFGDPYLKCLSKPETKHVLVEFHEGICSNHLSGLTLVHHAYTQGYY